MGERWSILCLPDRYPGLKFTARYIGHFFPKCDVYIEPFAGLARTAKYARCSKMVLNDRSEHSNKSCKKLFPNAIITNEDFIKCMEKWDGVNNFFLIDYPWRADFYEEKQITFCDRKPPEYERILEEICPKLKANFIICTEANRKLNFEHTITVRDPRPRLFGCHSTTRMYSNKPFQKQNPTMEDFYA